MSCDSCGCLSQVVSICENYNSDKRNLIPILHDIQDAMGYISPDAMETVADKLGITSSQVHGVATFYTLFYTEPHGKNIIRLCDSPPCHIMGSKTIIDAVSKELGIVPGETTTDGQFTLEIVSCMGLCGVSPAMMVNDDVYGNLTPEAVPGILAKYAAVAMAGKEA